MVSDMGHYSVSKAIDVLGLGTLSVVSIPTVGFVMDVNALRAKLDELKQARRRVVAIVAVAGTTEAGSFDPIRAIHALAQQHGAWLHVDAAWGGSLVFARSVSHLFDGIELADSITVDAHKGLCAPMGFGIVLFRSPHAVSAITKVAQYIVRKDSEDVGKHTLEGSRPASALQLHASLHMLGRAGFEAVAEHKLHVAAEFAKMINADDGFDLIAPPDADILLFRAHCGRNDKAAAVGADDGTADEAYEAELDQFNTRLQDTQKLLGRTFVSRTAVRDPRRSRECKTVVLRVVINPHVSLESCASVLDDLRVIGTALQLNPAPLTEARTLTQALAHSVLHVPHVVAVRTSDVKPPPSAAVTAAAPSPGMEACVAPTRDAADSGAAGVNSVTYWQLLREAMRVCGSLLATAAAGSVVPIMADRNVDAYVAIVACLLRGCAWLMIDSSLPPQRVAHLLAEATPSSDILVSDNNRGKWESVVAKLMAKGSKHALRPRFLTPFLHDVRTHLAPPSSAGAATNKEKGPPPPLVAPVAPSAAERADAYMIFTSGSTGLPKAVKIAHLQLVDMLRAFATHWSASMEAGKDTAIAQIAWAWDMHVLDMWLPLTQGATVRLLRDAERLDGARVATVIDRAAAEAAERGGAVRWMQGTPTFYRTLVNGGWLGDGGRGLTLIASGEPMPPDLARTLLLRCNKLVNCYGLTECTIFQSFEELKLPQVVFVDGLARDPTTGQLRLPDINCGRPCYSLENDDKCEVLLCRVAEGELPPAEDTDEGGGTVSVEDDALCRAKEVRSGRRLEIVMAPGVVGQVRSAAVRPALAVSLCCLWMTAASPRVSSDCSR